MYCPHCGRPAAQNTACPACGHRAAPEVPPWAPPFYAAPGPPPVPPKTTGPGKAAAPPWAHAQTGGKAPAAKEPAQPLPPGLKVFAAYVVALFVWAAIQFGIFFNAALQWVPPIRYGRSPWLFAVRYFVQGLPFLVPAVFVFVLTLVLLFLRKGSFRLSFAVLTALGAVPLAGVGAIALLGAATGVSGIFSGAVVVLTAPVVVRIFLPCVANLGWCVWLFGSRSLRQVLPLYKKRGAVRATLQPRTEAAFLHFNRLLALCGVPLCVLLSWYYMHTLGTEVNTRFTAATAAFLLLYVALCGAALLTWFAHRQGLAYTGIYAVGAVVGVLFALGVLCFVLFGGSLANLFRRGTFETLLGDFFTSPFNYLFWALLAAQIGWLARLRKARVVPKTATPWPGTCTPPPLAPSISPPVPPGPPPWGAPR